MSVPLSVQIARDHPEFAIVLLVPRRGLPQAAIHPDLTDDQVARAFRILADGLEEGTPESQLWTTPL